MQKINFARAPLVCGLALLVIACDPPSSNEPAKSSELAPEISDVTVRVPMFRDFAPVEPRMRSNVYQASIHLFTTGFSPEMTRDAAKEIKELALGDSAAPTCYSGPKGRAQLAVQTEFIAPEFANAANPAAGLAALDARLDALFDEGLAVQLLLPIHNVRELPTGWSGVDWEHTANWSNSSAFVPMKPCANALENGSKCAYDVLFENFHVPVIEHLVATGRADKLAVIYVANEFGYRPDGTFDTAADWGGAPDWKLKRAEALAYTAMRALNNARDAAAGVVPVGLKFAAVDNQHTGWAPDPVHYTDQLAYILNDVMAPNHDVLGYDVYFADATFDAGNRARLSGFLPLFDDGRFAIAEFGRICRGLPGEFVAGARTRMEDITGAAAAWPYSRGINLFAFTTSQSDSEGGCYALTNPVNMGEVYEGASDEALGLRAQMLAFTGEPASPCGEE